MLDIGKQISQQHRSASPPARIHRRQLTTHRRQTACQQAAAARTRLVGQRWLRSTSWRAANLAGMSKATTPRPRWRRRHPMSFAAKERHDADRRLIALWSSVSFGLCRAIRLPDAPVPASVPASRTSGAAPRRRNPAATEAPAIPAPMTAMRGPVGNAASSDPRRAASDHLALAAKPGNAPLRQNRRPQDPAAHCRRR